MLPRRLWLQQEAGTAQICLPDQDRNCVFTVLGLAIAMCTVPFLLWSSSPLSALLSPLLSSSVLQLCGCGLLGVGIWLSVSQGSFATFSPSLPALSAANMVIGIGAIVMVTGFLGCLGSIKENKCLLLSVS